MTTRKTSSYIRIAGGIICLLFSLAACDNQTIYHTYQNLSIEGWKKTDTLKYQLPAQLAGKQYDLEVGLRHTENYPYQDIWMEILYPLSPDRHPDTLHITLADKQVNWKGNGTSSNLYQYTSPHHPVTFSPSDSMVQIIHIMRDEPLKGISDVGIRLLPLTSSINTQKDK